MNIYFSDQSDLINHPPLPFPFLFLESFWLLQNFLKVTNFLKQQKQSPQVFCKNGALKNFAIFEVSFYKFADLPDCNLIKKRLQHTCFPVNIAKFLKTFILKRTCERLLLKQLFYKALVSSCFCIGYFIKFR